MQQQLLGVDEAELGGKGYKDDWKTKGWRSLVRFLLLGSYLQGAADESSPQKEALLPVPGPSPSKLSQGGAEVVGECGQDNWKTKGWEEPRQVLPAGQPRPGHRPAHVCTPGPARALPPSLRS